MPRPVKISKTDINVRPCAFAAKPEYRFVVTIPKPGSRDRQRKFFATRGEAETYAQSKRTELANRGKSAAELTTEERAEYLWARDALADYGLTVREVVTQALPGLKVRRRSCVVDVLVDEMLARKERDGLSVRHLQDLRSRLGAFVRDFTGRSVAEITQEEVAAWLDGLAVGAQGRNNYRQRLHVLFAFGVDRGYVLANPVAKVSLAKVIDRAPGILTPDQAQALLDAADPKILPCLAVGLFCGLRSAELARLDWSEIRLDRGHVEVTAGKSKTARRRLVEIPDNLRAWLQPHVRPAGPVLPANARRLLDAARAGAGIAEWPENAARHSFASYWLAMHEDAARLALLMGHTSNVMVFQHYRAVVDRVEAARFWAVRPQAAATIEP